ncbi:helix-turn-helix domain-containing protein [Palleronia caenipelagi]|uniref:Helix-turn-helix domain-containing protein n=1 Tax=Palleronia caenipelagi TaxID=2489174 RepID=A0A547QAQ6_9RHOB|nr:XRE family transcriptional regulator [Palleronia caenipelagi]TRD23471.1 helix-turn-helix domain-containing protein [Palleronia caenipelagi]
MVRDREHRLTGARIRARRAERRMTQAALAEAAGISASYLNLIEHDKRRIGGGVLGRVARALGTDPATLTEGLGPDLYAALESVAERIPSNPPPERDRIDGLATDYPGWAALIAALDTRVAALEHRITALGERMSHDPVLSEAVHDVLSTVTAIRSTAGILAEDGLDPQWQARFHRNLHEDSQRLADGAQRLAGYLNVGEAANSDAVSPQEEVEAWLSANDWSLDMSESCGLSEAGETALARHTARVTADADCLPDEALRAALKEVGLDPFRLADTLGAPVTRVIRRLAALPARAMPRPLGLVEIDGAGALLFRRQVTGFLIPRYGAACALWPVFEALLTPAHPIHRRFRQHGRDTRPLESWSAVDLTRPGGLAGPVVARAVMLVAPLEGVAGDGVPETVGASCALCPAPACPVRRESAVL